jgi:2-dehydro-3-deoxyglucarate aldolase/4-hydroxy-2-oxoheptanedioate aldolase
MIKILKHAGFDFIFVENEHTLLMGPALADFVQCARDNQLPTIIKTGGITRSEVTRLLDAGVSGTQLPWTESRADVEAMLDLMRFHPRGCRPGAPCFGNADYLRPADDAKWLSDADSGVLFVAHIETRRGLENAREIISTPGLEAVYVGIYDLSISLGCPRQYDHPRLREAVFSILKLCREHNVAFGTTAANLQTARDLVQQGCRFFEDAHELTLLYRAAAQYVQTYRTQVLIGGD